MGRRGGEGINMEGERKEGKIIPKKSEKSTMNHSSTYLPKLHTLHISLYTHTHTHTHTHTEDVIPTCFDTTLPKTIDYLKIIKILDMRKLFLNLWSRE